MTGKTGYTVAVSPMQKYARTNTQTRPASVCGRGSAFEQSRLTHTRAHSFWANVPIGSKRHGLSSPRVCPEVSGAFRKSSAFSVANAFAHHLVVAVASVVDTQLGLVPPPPPHPPQKNKPKLHNAFFSLSTSTPAISDCWKEGILKQNRPFFHHPPPPPPLVAENYLSVS